MLQKRHPNSPVQANGPNPICLKKTVPNRQSMGYNEEQSKNSCSVPVEKVKEKDRLQEHIEAFDSSTVLGLGSPGQRHSVTNALIREILHPIQLL